MYEQGEGIAKDRGKAFYWYEQSAMAGDATAKVGMANRYFEDKRRGPSKYVQGSYWLMLSYFDALKSEESEKSS
ncbi:MAG: hypothetical protein H2174_09985 [Vampirovibrio sp.]|nr:hypothetical protein [Vampirovibrio sp.]